MKVKFTPSAAVPVYRVMHGTTTLVFDKAGVVDVPDELGKVLLVKRPELFGVSDPGGNVKATDAPEHNRMFSKPKRNK